MAANEIMSYWAKGEAYWEGGLIKAERAGVM